uniref:Uncharacterized protein n=2 Tax=Oryza TaxID=4527 RepID=A0A0D3FAU6_9ORYZ
MNKKTVQSGRLAGCRPVVAFLPWIRDQQCLQRLDVEDLKNTVDDPRKRPSLQIDKYAVQGESDFMLPLETLDSLTMSRSGIRWAPTGEEVSIMHENKLYVKGGVETDNNYTSNYATKT